MYKKLKDMARVMRCQIRREETAPPENPVYWRRSYLPVWHELGLEDIDAHTGLILEPRLKAVKPARDPGLFAVAPGDILLCFLGSPARIGATGLMIRDYAAIPASNMCIIRACDCDPIWLFYRLREEDVGRELTVNGEKGKAFLSLSRIRELELELPREQELEKINLAHGKVLSSYQKTLKLLRREREIIKAAIQGERENLLRKKRETDKNLPQ